MVVGRCWGGMGEERGRKMSSMMAEKWQLLVFEIFGRVLRDLVCVLWSIMETTCDLDLANIGKWMITERDLREWYISSRVSFHFNLQKEITQILITFSLIKDHRKHPSVTKWEVAKTPNSGPKRILKPVTSSQSATECNRFLSSPSKQPFASLDPKLAQNKHSKHGNPPHVNNDRLEPGQINASRLRHVFQHHFPSFSFQISSLMLLLHVRRVFRV